MNKCIQHRAGRVPTFLSSRPNRVYPPSHPQASYPPLVPGRGGGGGAGAYLLAGVEVGGPNSDEGTDTAVL